VTGLDLVEEQIRIAEGGGFTFGDTPPEPRGWAIEVRVIAEDPLRNFMPSVGRIERVRFPHGPGVRVDGGFYRGYTIPIYYDSLLTKLIAWGRDREHARRRLLRALEEFALEGVNHNLMFHRWLLAHPKFIAGELSTRFIEENFRPEVLAPGPEATEAALVAAALHARDEHEKVAVPDARAGGRSVWKWGGRPAGGRTR
jgi:acetyl-CoA carboxylase, biotin carboxylase subunit